MPRFKVAHIREQGIDLIIVPLDAAFGSKTSEDQQEIIAELQLHASGAGLAGTVVPVWNAGGRMAFIAPENWHSFFRNITLARIVASINREIFW